jgi:RHS repeat-associated protein
MKRFLLSIIVTIFSISTFLAQSKAKTLKTPKNTFFKDTVSNGLILSKEIISIKGTVPKRQRDTLTLSKVQVRKSHKKSTMMREPWEEVEPDNPVDPDPVDPVDPIDPTDPTLPGGNGVTIDAGKTPATLDVSAIGGATYTIPVSLPPGIGNMIPQISLSYNSHADKGIAGLGWNISGLSSISRIPTTMFHDSRMDGVNYDDNDRFALDGQRLMLKSGIYGKDGAEYQTEVYSNLRIISHGASPFGNNSGPEYFEVIYPDGSKAFYGSSTDSRSPNQYSLTYIENPLGARITYFYTNNGSSLLISQIQYGSMNTASGINQIIFSYDYASRAEQGYIAGTSFYQGQILKKISVYGNMGNYRHYRLTHNTVTGLNYDRLVSIQEFDGNEQHAFNPIHFSYNSTGDVIVNNSINNLSVSGIASNNSEVVTADFTGNGSMDFLLYPKYNKDKFWTFYDVEANSSYYQMGTQINSGPFIELFPVTELTYNDKILAGQNIAVVKSQGSAYKFDIYAAVAYSPVLHQYSKTWDNVPLGPMFYSNCDFTDKQYPLEFQFLSGDFNGDGMTDVIAVNYGSVITYENQQPSDDPYYNPGNCDQGYTDVGSTAYLINLDRRLTSNFVSNLGMLAASYDYYGKLLTGDFNGDGKTDILQIQNGWIYVYGINNSGVLQLLWSANDYRINNGQQFLAGDYNGDGKLDLMMATGNNSYFITFMSSGKSFTKHEQYMPFSNTAGNWNGNSPGTLTLYYLIPNDVDGDGKTDIISAQTVTTNNSDNGSTYLTVYYAGNQSSNSMPSFYYSASTSRYGSLKHNPIPIFLNSSKPNVKLEFGFMSNNSISLYKFGRDFRSESQIASIYQDGVTHTIEYKVIDGSQNYSSDIALYQTSLDQTYPYIDLQTLPGLYVVSKLNRYYGGQQVSQVFGYGKAVTHVGGLGFQGFGELIRSNWHVNNSGINRVFNISISNPQLRGATVRSFNSKSTYINPGIKDIALTPLVTADGATLNDYISRTDQTYNTQLLPNKVFINAAVGTVTKDMLTETFSTQIMEYDNFYNVTKSTSNFNGEGSKVIDIAYDNNPSANYIGRILFSKATLSNGAEFFTTEDQYEYSGFLPIQVKKKGNNTGWVIEDMIYDGFGNVTQKTTTAPGGAQHSVAMDYDATGRFMISSTDIDGMISSGSYDNSTGNLLTVTNPFGQTTTNNYDTWGKVISSTDYLGNSTVTTYAATSLGGTSITRSNDEGNITASFFNALGQKTGSYSKTVLGDNLATETEYDIYGRFSRQSEPAAQGSASQWNETTYDVYGRVKQMTSFTGKITNISYSGLSTTVNDGTKSVTTTKNAMGQIVILQDPGGTINYSYYANGNMKTANYGGTIQSIEQDGWGRKTKLTDPSAGVYEYQYDNWGQLIKEITPKGLTEISYDSTGKISQKKLTGDDTNIQQDYIYDGTTKLLTSMVLTNADGNNATYTYNYDGYKRISSTIEDNLHARFVKGYTYDSFGRISTESYEAKNKANNIIATKTIELQYQNGELLQTTLQGSGQILWKVTALDSKGNLTQAIQGTALKNTMQYDNFGLPQQSLLENVSATPVTLMSLGYSYDAQRGLLNSRSNSAFTWNESFSYDIQNRLTAFNDNTGSNNQDYDNRGRIIDNSQLGTYTYDGNTYRQSGLTLNATANSYYQNDHPLQQINYNAFKSPVEIIEQGKERISFQYNASLGRAHMYYGDDQADKMLRRYRKHYSEDGGMEITNDLQTGKTSFVFYLVDDAYTSPAMWKEEHLGGIMQTAKLYYLHRDHLGSIVMITNDQGGVVEKRQFDAWGNIVKLQDGLGNDLPGFFILDRGYTGHEHLLGVGLIHMNGRLYDPKLHRFLSPDNFVQDPYNTQNYNRYGYAMNNPLMFTDPSGEFIWAFFAVGALIGALTGGISYVASAISTDSWSWRSLGMSMLSGAIIGGITGGFNPAGLISNSLTATFGTAFVAGFMPSANFSIGDFNFSISPSIVFGKSFGMGANLSVGYSTGKWSFAAGFGVMAYGNYQGFGKGGAEIRASLMAGYDNGTNGFSLGTNQWWGTEDMKEFKQRTGLIGAHFGEFRVMYENDGGAGIKHLKLGNKGDSYRTAALNISYKDFSVGFNLFTGYRGVDNQKEEEKTMLADNKGNLYNPITNDIDDFGRKYKRGYVLETGSKYRMGILSGGFGNYRVGVNSEHIRHGIQDRFIHGLIGDRGFQNLSWDWNGFSQFKTPNQFTSW